MATLAEGEDRIGRASRNLSFLFLFLGISLGKVRDSRLRLCVILCMYVCVYVCARFIYVALAKKSIVILLDMDGDSELVN